MAKPLIPLTEQDGLRLKELSRAQEAEYGRDTGAFTLGTGEDAHAKGFAGEIAVIKYLEADFKLVSGQSVGHCPIGSEFDVYAGEPDHRRFLHVKTGFYNSWPARDAPFGIHAHQRVEETNAPLILCSVLKSNRNEVRIEGYVTPWELAAARVVLKGEQFPNRSYRSRTDNRLTYIGEYKPLVSIEAMFNDVDSPPG